MSKNECVKNAINHKKTEYVPHSVELTKVLESKIAAELKLEKGSFFSWAGNHIEKCGFEKGEHIKPGFIKDEYGVVWDRSGPDKDIGIIDNIIFKDPDISTYSFPKINKQEIEDRCESFLKEQRDTFKFSKIGTTLFERAWSLRGFENLFMDFLLEEKFAHELLEKITDRNIQILEIALKYEFDGVYFGDDYGQQNSLMMSPQIWRKFLKPQLKRMFDLIKSKGSFICLHSCGDIGSILSDLTDIGLDIYQTVQPEIYDLQKLKKEYGQDLSFYGAISTQRDLPNKKPKEIRQIIKRTMEVLGEGGGYIAAPTHRVTADVPIENVVAMIEAFKNQ